VLPVEALTDDVRSGRVTIQKIVSDGLARARDDAFGAWVMLDTRAREDAEKADARGDVRPLSGVTVGVKDLFAVAGLPSRAGSRLTPAAPRESDAEAVRRLRELGAAILGTTTMPEFAFGPTPGARNPLDPAHTPGSSSAGSAIAVAAGQVAVGLATQTNGSIIRPAAYCGVAGLKPTHGAMPTDGVPRLVPTLDQPGFIAASARSLQAVWTAWTGRAAEQLPDRPPVVALIRTPRWHNCEPTTQAAIEAMARSLDAEELEVPDEFGDVWAWMDTIIAVELAESLAAYDDQRYALTTPIQEAIRVGRATSPQRYTAALTGRHALQSWAEQRLGEFDAIITPATTGPAPRLEDGAGSPEFCTLWSLAGVPAVTIPIPGRTDRLPIGVQLVAAPGRDARLLELAAVFQSAPADQLAHSSEEN
jgi:Asp-tRNA(Asn)/Glu-tRNA(Gln) amidotransferase A subunit family amidase